MIGESAGRCLGFVYHQVLLEFLQPTEPLSQGHWASRVPLQGKLDTQDMSEGQCAVASWDPPTNRSIEPKALGIKCPSARQTRHSRHFWKGQCAVAFHPPRMKQILKMLQLLQIACVKIWPNELARCCAAPRSSWWSALPPRSLLRMRSSGSWGVSHQLRS